MVLVPLYEKSSKLAALGTRNVQPAVSQRQHSASTRNGVDMASAHIHPVEPPNWANHKVVRCNALPPRAYFHVYETKAKALTKDTAQSRCQLLSGPDSKWLFDLEKSPFDGATTFHENGFDASSWKEIKVPGMWQLQGFGRGPQYTNVIYPFPCDPPYIPYDQNECGRYVTEFKLNESMKDKDGHLRLRFEGVDSSFTVWLNGTELGYSQGSRNPSEFDITNIVHLDGENELKVEVYQFCDGSYLEDQDQWWLSGIFRDVYIHSFPKVHIEDFFVQTLLDDDYKDASLKVDVQLNGGSEVSLQLLDASGKEVVSMVQHVDKGWTFEMRVADPAKWTAETPNLYTLTLGIKSCYLTQNIGFRRAELIDGVFCVNGNPVKFRGTNRHENHPDFGRAVPLDFAKHDFLLMKAHNINGIRTSHYINDPRVYALCDELGLWVLNEADLECHGFGECGQNPMRPESFTSDNPEWKEHYEDRARQMVMRDRNHPCIILWSLGNEAFYGRNHQAMYDEIKRLDKSRMVHYEPDQNARTADIYSRMYAHVDTIEWFATQKNWTKPLVLCEYIHAMGNGPGGAQEYIEAFYKYPRLMGGFVWEWANHGLRTYSKDGDEYMGYGGDFGEEVHDGKFILDGLLFSNHTPQPGLIEYKKLIEPVQTLHLEGNKVTVINRYDFIGIEHLKCTWKIVADGMKDIDGGEIELPKGLKPHTKTTLVISDLPPAPTDEAYLTVIFTTKEDKPWASTGHVVAWGQLLMTPPKTLAHIKALAAAPQTLTVNQVAAQQVSISAPGGTDWIFNPVHGTLTSWCKKGGKNIITLPPAMDFYRAETDNDSGGHFGPRWLQVRLHQTREHVRKVMWQHNHEQATCSVVVDTFITPPVLNWGVETTTTYTFGSDGSVCINVKGKPRGDCVPETFARIGYTVGIAGVDKVKWFGRGPGEGYADKKQAQAFGTWEDTVDGLWVDYEYPQDGAQRADVRWVEFKDKEGERLVRARFGDLENASFTATHYTTRDVDESKHPYELHKKKRDDTIARLDFAHQGLGSGSCGPSTLPKYQLRPKEFEYELLLD